MRIQCNSHGHVTRRISVHRSVHGTEELSLPPGRELRGWLSGGTEANAPVIFCVLLMFYTICIYNF